MSLWSDSDICLTSWVNYWSDNQLTHKVELEKKKSAGDHIYQRTVLKYKFEGLHLSVFFVCHFLLETILIPFALWHQWEIPLPPPAPPTSVTRILTQDRKHDHITTLLFSLHWLPVAFIIGLEVSRDLWLLYVPFSSVWSLHHSFLSSTLMHEPHWAFSVAASGLQIITVSSFKSLLRSQFFFPRSLSGDFIFLLTFCLDVLLFNLWSFYGF